MENQQPAPQIQPPPRSPPVPSESDEKGAEEKNKESEEFISLKVMSQDGSEVWFKLRKETPLQKLFDNYCQRQGLSQASVRFLVDGQRVKGTDTPKSLQLEQDDIVDCCIMQVGG
jgi:small ubiquitin-related modifier